MSCRGGVRVDPIQRRRMNRNVADLRSLPMHPKVLHPAPLLDVFDFEFHQLFGAQAVIQKRRQNRAVAFALQCVAGRGGEQLPRLGIADRRRLAFVGLRGRPLDAVHRVQVNCVRLAQVFKERRHRRQLPPNGRRRQVASLQVFPPGDDMRPRDRADGGEVVHVDAVEVQEVVDVELVRPAGVAVADVGKPLGFGRDVGQRPELLFGQSAGSTDRALRFFLNPFDPTAWIVGMA